MRLAPGRSRLLGACALIVSALLLSSCAVAVVGGTVVGATANVAGAAISTTGKAAVGATKLTYRGGRAVVGAVTPDPVCDGSVLPYPEACFRR
ncbi:MAG: hypothetical protein AAF321_04765 [Pseudomonadota bacterium]